MKKRIQRKPFHPQVAEPKEVEKIDKEFNFKDIITILGGITGLAVAVLWLAGRSYTAGYFSSMNIPSFQINLSVWEYAEASWQRLIYYFAEKLYMPLLLVASVILVVMLASVVTHRFLPAIKLFEAVRILDNKARERLRAYRFIIGLSIVAYLFYLLLLALLDINSIGKSVGKDTVLRNSYLVDVYSTISLPLDQGEILQNNSPALIRYSNLHLLTYNNGKYFLYRELNPANCRPAKVYIVEESQFTYFAIGNISPINTPCDETAVP